MEDYNRKLIDNKNIIFENIEQGKKSGVNKVSAVFAIDGKDEVKNKMVNELATWLIQDGYKISLKQDELKILIIEWD